MQSIGDMQLLNMKLEEVEVYNRLLQPLFVCSVTTDHLFSIAESVMKKAYPGVSQADVKGTIQRWMQKARLRAFKEANDPTADIFAP
ncbi:hypothetical protein EG68_10174 [Paragonimus skrjabini miyazakii]|uniref:Uncharacterized protein n=1 Tax=Paragonimus skrjabini miyazakii TaxID=59628 RepID=A0A8S9YG60_9TREM|nr:hypothetical protein EG68_10174 [Paragonimus skrjabini miyazakii]